MSNDTYNQNVGTSNPELCGFVFQIFMKFLYPRCGHSISTTWSAYRSDEHILENPLSDPENRTHLQGGMPTEALFLSDLASVHSSHAITMGVTTIGT